MKRALLAILVAVSATAQTILTWDASEIVPPVTIYQGKEIAHVATGTNYTLPSWATNGPIFVTGCKDPVWQTNIVEVWITNVTTTTILVRMTNWVTITNTVWITNIVNKPKPGKP